MKKKDDEVQTTDLVIGSPSNNQMATVMPIAEFEKMKAAGAAVAQSQFFGSGLNAAGGFMVLATMYKENLSPVEFKRRYHMVGNNPSRVTNSLLGDFKLTGGKWKIHQSDEKVCKITFTTRDGDEYTQEVSMEKYLLTDTPWTDATHKQLKSNWKNNPDDMLFARCCAKALRRIAPELMGGVYSREEQEDIVADTVVPTIASEQAKEKLAAMAASAPSAPSAPAAKPVQKKTSKKPEVEVVDVEVAADGQAEADAQEAAVREAAEKEAEAKRVAEENAKADLAAKREAAAKEAVEKAEAEKKQAAILAEAENLAREHEKTSDFEVCPVPGQMFGKRWDSMTSDILSWAYNKIKEKYPEYILDGHIDCIRTVLIQQGVLDEES